MKDTPEDADTRLLLKDALLSLRAMGGKIDALESGRTAPIAIIGQSCRFPGAEDTDAFWRLLRDGVDAAKEIPADRWNIEAYDLESASEPGKPDKLRGGFLDSVDRFDTQFFGISPREVASMDPQQRLLLEAAWEALEHAGLAPQELSGSRTGVFVGISSNEYLHCNDRSGAAAYIDPYFATGNSYSVAAGRLSYIFGFHAPSYALDTSCSSSLVAVHLACQSLRNGECTMALAGGVNVMLSPFAFIALSRMRALAPDGRCKAFDASADGMGRGEGCGMVVLKRLSDAMKDGDNILAVIRGSAVNQNGRSSGLTVPNGLAQQSLLREALSNAKVSPSQVSYVECHGTGTPLGDPIEVEALGAVLGEGRGAHEPLMIGSVKSNIGHLEAAAGIAGLIKVVLALQHGEIPPHLHFKEPNPHIAWDRLPLSVPTKRQPWPAGNGRRLAGVSSFGFSGTNAHVIVEEAPVAGLSARAFADRPLQVLCLSAKSAGALRDLAGRYASHLSSHGELPWGDVCFTANTGRGHFAHRLALVAGSAGEASGKLSLWLQGSEEVEGLFRGEVRESGGPKVAFLFTGQGSQYPEMGRALYEGHRGFRAVLDRCAAVLSDRLAVPLVSVVYPSSGESDLLNDTSYTQPALFGLEMALSEVWRSWGIEPSWVMGHSLGEYAAACVSGVLGLEDGARLAAARGFLMQSSTPAGSMAAVFADASRVLAALAGREGEVSIAAFNGPTNTVISGVSAAVESVVRDLERSGVECRRLDVPHAGHSALMEPMREAFWARAGEVVYQSPRVGWVSNVTGEPVSSGEVSAAYWSRHLREPVQFERGMRTLRDQGCDAFVEIGPHPTLLGMAWRCVEADAGAWLASLRNDRGPWEQMLESLAQLYIRGASPDWSGFDADYPRRRVLLPTYPFQRRRYWIGEDSQASVLPIEKDDGRATLSVRGRRIDAALEESLFEFAIKSDEADLWAYPRVCRVNVLPLSMYMAMALSVVARDTDSGDREVENLSLCEPLILSEDGCHCVQLVLDPEKGSARSFRIASRADAQEEDSTWQWCATGAILKSNSPCRYGEDVQIIRARCNQELPLAVFHQTLNRQGLEYRSGLRRLKRLWYSAGEAIGEVVGEEGPGELRDSVLHPALCEACIQVVRAINGGSNDLSNGIFLPVGLERADFFRDAGAAAWCHAVLKDAQDTQRDCPTADLSIFGEDGRLVAKVVGLRFRRIDRAIVTESVQSNINDWTYDLEWQVKTSAPTDRSVKPSLWLILADASALATKLAARLEEQGQDCVLVSAVHEESASKSDQRRLHPCDGAGFHRLLESMAKNERPFGGIVHLWALDCTETNKSSVTSVQEDQKFVCASVLHLIQALSRTGLSGSPGLWLVTRGAQAIGSLTMPLSVSQSTMWGLGRVLSLEHPERRCVKVDLDPVHRENDAERIVSEIQSLDGEDQVAFRDGQRYVARLKHSRIWEDGASVPSGLAPRGTYLITGGLGDLGLSVADWMVSQGAKHIVLAGRSGLPARDGWNRLDLDARTRSRIGAIRALEEQGAEVSVHSVDVSDAGAMQSFFQQLSREHPPLRGVVHAAGVGGSQLLKDMNYGSFQEMLRPKLAGAWNLHELTKGIELDFFVCFSSGASLWGFAGLGHYAAANSFLDVLAHHRRSLGLPALSINWGAWARKGWAHSSEHMDWLEKRGIGALQPEEAVEGMGILINRRVTQRALAVIDWSLLKPVYEAVARSPFLQSIDTKRQTAACSSDGFVRRLRSAPPEARYAMLMTRMREDVAHVVGIAPSDVDIQEPLQSLGFDSLMALDLKARIEMALDTVVSMELFFVAPTIDAMSRRLLDEMDSEEPTRKRAATGAAVSREVIRL